MSRRFRKPGKVVEVVWDRKIVFRPHTRPTEFLSG
jgi:hypothetical protein